ncbi:MAG: 30S ribosomal protein S21 [Planctomycetes bacterium]|nr:30S ribosomal protein S21 [Planctomycetota bacterium]
MSIRIQLRDNEPVDKALRKLKRLCANEGVYTGFKARKFYEKPSERRRRKAKERMKVIRIANRIREQM